MHYINLYIAPPKQRLDLLSPRGMLLLLGVLCTGLSATYALAYRNFLDRQQLYGQFEAQREQRSTQLAQLVASMPPQQLDPSIQQSIDRLNRELQIKPRLVAALQGEGSGSQTGFAPFLEGLARRTPEGVWLTGIEILGGGRNVVLHGHTVKAELLGDFLQNLAEESVFHGKSFGNLVIERPDPEQAAIGGEALRFILGDQGGGRS